LGNILDGYVLAEFSDLSRICDFLETHLLCYLPIHTQHRRNSFLGKKKDLQHEVIPLVSSSAHACLVHQDKACQENRFYGDQRPSTE
jgi:hypothetical protein